MRTCSEIGCRFPVFGTDKLTRLGYCQAHQHLRTDIDRRSSYEKHMDKIEGESQSNLIEDLDAFFSKYIRLKYADSSGMVECYTCGYKDYYKYLQNGHFVHRADLATRWLNENCRPQCQVCNMINKGELEVFAKKLEEERPGITEWLKEQSREVYKPSLEELKGMISEMRSKVRLLERKLVAEASNTD